MTTGDTEECRPIPTSRQASRDEDDADIVDFSGRIYNAARAALAAKAWPIKALPTAILWLLACINRLGNLATRWKLVGKTASGRISLGCAVGEFFNSKLRQHQLRTPQVGFRQGDAPLLQT